jgi:hypothetical protein
MKKLGTLVGMGFAVASLTFAGPAFAANGGHAGSPGPSPAGNSSSGIAARAGDGQTGPQGTGAELPLAPVGESVSSVHFTGGLF